MSSTFANVTNATPVNWWRSSYIISIFVMEPTKFSNSHGKSQEKSWNLVESYIILLLFFWKKYMVTYCQYISECHQLYNFPVDIPDGVPFVHMDRTVCWPSTWNQWFSVELLWILPNIKIINAWNFKIYVKIKFTSDRCCAHRSIFSSYSQSMIIACCQLNDCFIFAIFFRTDCKMDSIWAVQYVDVFEISGDFQFCCEPWKSTHLNQMHRIKIQPVTLNFFGMLFTFDVVGLRFMICIIRF